MKSLRRLFVEGLENRAMLAGNVNVSVSGGDLIITGDNFSNGVSVQQIDNGRYFVTGFALGGGNTTINGQAGGRIVSGVVNDINVDLNGGDDAFIMTQNANQRAAMAAEVTGGTAGAIAPSPVAPNVNTTETFQTRVNGHLNIVTDAGNDGVGISARAGTLNRRSTINIQTGGGADHVVTERVTAFDDLLINTGDGRDNVRGFRVRTHDFLFADLGAGNDTFFTADYQGFHAQVFGGDGNDFVRAHDFHADQEVFLYGNAGDDTLDGNGVTGSHITLAGHEGRADITLTNSWSRGNILITGGELNDNVTLGHIQANVDLLVFLYGGADRLTISQLQVNNHFTADGGSGFDTFDNNGGNNVNSSTIVNFENNI